MQYKKTSKMNISKYIMVIAAAVIIIGTAAFKGIETFKAEVKIANLDEVPFYHIGGGQYKREAPSEKTSCKQDDKICTITYLEASAVEGIDEFTLPEQPDGEVSNSANGVWQ
jgi:hypothetical protein